MNAIKIVMRFAIGAVVVTVFVLGVVGALTGVRAVPVLTGSMRPNYPPGTLVFTHRVSSSSLKVGDVIAFAPPAPFTTPHNQPIMHRIVRIDRVGNDLHIKTRGDNNPAPDAWTLNVTSSQSHELWFSVPYVGDFTAAIKNADWPIALLSLVGLTLMGVSIYGLTRRQESDNFSQPAGTHFADDTSIEVPLKFSEPELPLAPHVPTIELTREPLLFGSVSHELRSALTHVSTSVELAFDETEEDARKHLLNAALRGTRRLTSVCEKLLFAFGLETYRTETSVGVEKVVRAAVKEFGLPEERVWLTGNPVSSMILGSETSLRWAVYGMLEHAAFVSNHANDLMIELSESPGMTTIIVSVSIPVDVENRRKSWPTESSINLAMVQRAAIDHGGMVKVENKGQSVSIAMTLPLIFQAQPTV